MLNIGDIVTLKPLVENRCSEKVKKILEKDPWAQFEIIDCENVLSSRVEYTIKKDGLCSTIKSVNWKITKISLDNSLFEFGEPNVLD